MREQPNGTMTIALTAFALSYGLLGVLKRKGLLDSWRLRSLWTITCLLLSSKGLGRQQLTPRASFSMKFFAF